MPDTEDSAPLDSTVGGDDGGGGNWLYLIIVLVLAGAIGAFMVMNRKRKGKEPEEEGAIYEPAEAFEEPDDGIWELGAEEAPEEMPEETVPEPAEPESVEEPAQVDEADAIEEDGSEIPDAPDKSL